jgi:D-glycero-alpha-D-manno-heptose-7-phosphate kinase
VTRFSGINNWDVFKGQIEGLGSVRECLERIVRAAGDLREALLAGRLEDAPDLIDREWQARQRRAPGVTTPEIDRIVAAARAHGGAGKVCGAGGGGMVAVWCAPGRREETARATEGAGFARVPFRIAETGVAVSEV